MKGGRMPKPTALRNLMGRSHKKKNSREPQFPAADVVPYAPKWLCPPAREEWRRLIGYLIQAGLYTEADRSTLALYCQAFGRAQQAEERIGQLADGAADDGHRGQVTSVWERMAERRTDQARKLLAEFGLSPAERSRVVADVPEAPDELEQLFNRRVMVGSERE
jgi:P27 family predicted phage terminase small subunit